MSTRCLIGYMESYERVIYTYCHFDGYPSGVGKILKNHYNTPELAKAVASLDGISSLENTLEETKRNEYHDGMSGEMLHSKYRCTDNFGVDYVYLYKPSNKYCGHWTVRPVFGYDLDEIAEEDSWDKY